MVRSTPAITPLLVLVLALCVTPTSAWAQLNDFESTIRAFAGFDSEQDGLRCSDDGASPLCTGAESFAGTVQVTDIGETGTASVVSSANSAEQRVAFSGSCSATNGGTFCFPAETLGCTQHSDCGAGSTCELNAGTSSFVGYALFISDGTPLRASGSFQRTNGDLGQGMNFFFDVNGLGERLVELEATDEDLTGSTVVNVPAGTGLQVFASVDCAFPDPLPGPGSRSATFQMILEPLEAEPAPSLGTAGLVLLGLGLIAIVLWNHVECGLQRS